MTKEKVTLSNAIYVNGFGFALKELMEQPLKPFSAYSAADFAKQYDAKQEVFQSARKSIINRYYDEAGVVREEHTDPQVTGPEDAKAVLKLESQKEADAAFQELVGFEVEFELLKKISLKESDDIKLTPNSMLLLGDILDVTE